MNNLVIIANCQGEAFCKILKKHPDFSKEWNVEYFPNFTNPEIPDQSMENCDLLLYQKLEDKWGYLSEKSLLAKVNPKAKTIVMPNMMNYHLWPTAKWCNTHGPIWADHYIDDIIAKNLTFDETVHVILRTDLAKVFDLENMMRTSLQIEFGKNYQWREELLTYIEENWKIFQIFTTPSHPASKILFHFGNLFFRELNYKPLYFDENAFLYCDLEYFLPIHPFLKKYYDIKWMEDEMFFPVFKSKLTYKEYLCLYIDSRQKNIPLFYALHTFEKK